MNHKLILALLFFMIGIHFANAQSLNNIQNIQVDELSDAQIEQLVKRAEDQGVSKSQIPDLARERGLPAQEANKLATRISQLGMGNGQGTNGEGAQTGQRSIFEDSLSDQDEPDTNKLTEEQKKIFGFSLFRNKKLNFNPNLNIPTPSDYTIGTGDQLLIDVYGASQQSYDLTVNPEGRVYIPNVGPVTVGGSSIQAATSRLKSELSNIYSGLTGNNPNTFLQIRLGNIRSIQVSMVGELANPGNYTLPSFASVFNALYAAGGPNEKGSFRSIQVYRNSRKVAEVDVYEFLLNGDQQQNIRLQDNDVIMVPALQTRVEVRGPVRREGLFEIQPDESIQDLIRFAGGFSSEAYTGRLTVRRDTENAREVADVSQADYGTFRLNDGDEIMVGQKLSRFENRVQISGAVFRPGEFALEEGMSLKDLIDRAEGLRGEAFLNRATLYRTQEDLTLEIVPVDVQAVVNGEGEDILLQREDVLHIPSQYDIKEERYIKISGEVNRPGAFAYGENMSVEDLVLKAGGLKESASNAYIEVARRVKNEANGQIAEIITIDIDEDLQISPEDGELTLEPFDHVIIRQSPGYRPEKLVRVEGEVNYPGQFAIAHADERISDLLQRAGGLNDYAYPKGATLIRRTEYFEDKSENEIRAEHLNQVKNNLQKEDGKNTEAENVILARIDEKISERGGDLANQKGGLMADDFRANRVKEISQSDSTTKAEVTFRQQEMVGIDLNKIMAHPGSDEDLILQEGDILSIPKELQTVRMRGEVLFPTTARFTKNRGFKNYVSRAGGFSERARKGKSYVVYANGDVKRTKNFFLFKAYPKIEPGAEIIVPQKPERQPMPVQAWIGIASSMATLAIMIDRLSQ